tara:strand:- start:174 stop:569 length:396 start_codon:yes stop_codon:yes gene_type:complete
MKEGSNYIVLHLFVFILIIFTSINGSNSSFVSALEKDYSNFREKVSKAYTKKFCNSIGFGLSKDSALNFSIQENTKVFKKKKEMANINRELLAEEIAISVVENCGYPINLKGEKGIEEFKIEYLAKEKELN